MPVLVHLYYVCEEIPLPLPPVILLKRGVPQRTGLSLCPKVGRRCIDPEARGLWPVSRQAGCQPQSQNRL